MTLYQRSFCVGRAACAGEACKHLSEGHRARILSKMRVLLALQISWLADYGLHRTVRGAEVVITHRFRQGCCHPSIAALHEVVTAGASACSTDL